MKKKNSIEIFRCNFENNRYMSFDIGMVRYTLPLFFIPELGFFISRLSHPAQPAFLDKTSIGRAIKA